MRTVFITGASRGLGLEWVRQLLENGDRVFAGVRSPSSADELQDLADEYDDRCVVILIDVGDEKLLPVAFQNVAEHANHLDILINNAGIFNATETGRPRYGDIPMGSLEQTGMLEVFRINTIAPVLVTQQFLPLLKRGSDPKVVNISSSLGSISRADSPKYYAYRAGKAALNMMTKIMSMDLKQNGIAVASLHPGWVQTDMGGSSASLTPSESVSGMMDCVDNVDLQNTGVFMDHNGKEVPW